MAKKKQNNKALYAKYHRPGVAGGSAARSNRNKARRILGLETGDPREAHHIDGNPNNNARSNLRAVSKKTNRGKPRGKYRKH